MRKVLILLCIALLIISIGQADDDIEPPRLIEEDVIITVNGDGTITTIISPTFAYTPLDEDEPLTFTWELPGPSGTEVSFVERDAFELLRETTDFQVVEPPYYCSTVNNYPGSFDEDREHVTYLSVDSVEHDGNEFVYHIEDLVWRSWDDKRIQPPAIALTYESEQVSIPVHAEDDIALRVWIYGDTRYIPENYAHPQIDYTEFRGATSLWSDKRITYESTLKRFEEEYNGQFFVTEYAQPTSKLAFTEPNAFLADLNERFPYVTQLNGHLSTTLVPAFVSDDSLPDVHNIVELTDVGHDPLQFWRCSTRYPQDSKVDALLDDFLGGNSLYPDDWIITEPEEDYGSRFISPEVVSWDTVLNFLKGEDTPPMLVRVFTGNGPGNLDIGPWESILLNTDVITTDYAFENTDELSEFAESVIDPFELPDDQCVIFSHYSGRNRYQEIIYQYNSAYTDVLLTGGEDCDENRESYEAMFDFWRNDPYFSHPELRHTLFLGTTYPYNGRIYGSDLFIEAHRIGFPNGWIERMLNTNTIIIQPENMQYDDNAAMIKVSTIPINLYDQQGQPLDEIGIDYNISREKMNELDEFFTESNWCRGVIQIVEYKRDWRRGYITIMDGKRVVVEASAPIEIFDEYADDLRHSAESIDFYESACG